MFADLCISRISNGMKLALGILVALVVALGVWLSLTLGSTAPAQPQGTAATSTPAGWQAYENTQFSLSYPDSYMVDEAHRYQLGPTQEIAGVKFSIPESMATGTNLSADTYVSVESRPGAINSCSAEIYLGDPHSAGFIDEGGRRYSIASSTGAAAGNRYEEWVFATPVDGGCIAVRYFIHYGVFENYPAGAVREFDRQALLSQFDQIRKSLVVK
jgi:hypothetical protein